MAIGDWCFPAQLSWAFDQRRCSGLVYPKRWWPAPETVATSEVRENEGDVKLEDMGNYALWKSDEGSCIIAKMSQIWSSG